MDIPGWPSPGTSGPGGGSIYGGGGPGDFTPWVGGGAPGGGQDPNQIPNFGLPPWLISLGGGDLGGGRAAQYPPLTGVPPPVTIPGTMPGTLGSSAGYPSLTSGVGLPTSTPLGFLTTLLNNLGKFAGQQAAQKAQRGSGGGGYEPVRGGGPGVTMLPPPVYAANLPAPVPFPQPIRGSFDQGGVADQSGLYQMEQGETVRTPGQEALLQTLLGASGLPVAAAAPGSGGPSVQPIPNATPGQAQAGPLPNATPGMAQVVPAGGGQQPGGIAFPGATGQISQQIPPPQFGDPGAFPRIPGIPESAITPEQAAGPGLPQPIQQQQMPGSFLSPGARTAWTVRDVLNNISQGAQNYQKMQWNKRMMTAQSMTMERIQQQMQAHPATQGAQPAPGQAQAAEQQPDPVQQAIQAAMQQTNDPKERQRLEKMLQQNQRAQQRKASEWAKIQIKAQDPTSPEFIGVQRAYGMARGMGEQALTDELLKAKAQASWLNAQAQLAEAQAKVRTAKDSQMVAGSMADEWDALNGNPPGTSRGGIQQTQPGAPAAPGQPTAPTQPGAAPSTTPAAPGAQPTAPKPTSALQTFIDTYGPLKGGQRALAIGAIKESVETGKTKPFYDMLKTVWSDNEKNLKVDSKLSEVVYDPDSTTKFSMWARNHQGEDIIDPKTQKQMLLVGVPRPVGAESASITQMKWTDASGALHLRPITNLRNVPVDPHTGRTSGGHIPVNPLPPPGTSALAGPGHVGETRVSVEPKGSPMTSPGTGGVAGGDIIIGQTKVPKLMGTTLPSGEQWAGTPGEAAAIGIPQAQLHELTAQQLNIVESAREITAPEGLIKEVEDDLKAFKPGELNWMNSRWQEFLNQGIGQYSDSRYNKLRTQLNGLLGTAIMQSHGVGRGMAIMEHFDNLAKAGTMSAETIRDAIDAEREYAEGRAERPKIRFISKDGTRARDIPSDRAIQFRGSKDGSNWRILGW